MADSNKPHGASSRAPVAMRAALHALRCWGVAAIVAAAAHAPAMAAPPAASTFVQCFADGNNAFHATECNQGGFPGVPPSAFAAATLAPFPSVSAEVTSPPAAVLGAGADANATYWFEVSGGSPGDLVPLMIDFALSASATPDSSALARLIVRTAAVPFSVEELLCNPQECEGTELSSTLDVQTRSGATLDSITLYVLVQSPATRVSHESASAFADPYIYIDPTFPNAHLYSIAVSPGVANVPLPAVPEPATPWLIAAGLWTLAGWRALGRARAAASRRAGHGGSGVGSQRAEGACASTCPASACATRSGRRP